jgi:hypothetical protein
MKSGRFVISSLLPDVSKIWSSSGVILEEFFLMIFMEYVPLCLRIVQKQIVYCAVEHNSLLFKNGCVFRPYATINSSLYSLWRIHVYFVPPYFKNTALLVRWWFYTTEIWLFLGAFAKLRKGIINFVVSVRPFVRPHETTTLPLDGF